MTLTYIGSLNKQCEPCVEYPACTKSWRYKMCNLLSLCRERRQFERASGVGVGEGSRGRRERLHLNSFQKHLCLIFSKPFVLVLIPIVHWCDGGALCLPYMNSHEDEETADV